MRIFALPLALALLLLPGMGVAAPATPPTPAPVTTPATIIPGTPLAVLAAAKAAAQPTAPDTEITAPFGSVGLGFSPGVALEGAAARALGQFSGNLRSATRLTPVVSWAASLPGQPFRRAEALAIAKALFTTLLPALVAYMALARGLRRPRAWCGARARPLAREFLPDADNQGLIDAEAGATEAHVRPRVSLRAWVRRLAFALLGLGLELLPLAGFGLVLAGLLALGVPGSKAAMFSAVGLGNGFLFWRAGLSGLDVLLAPTTPSLRLVGLSTPRAVWLRGWASALFGTVFAGFCVVSTAELLGLPGPGATALVRLIALAVHIELALWVWQARHVVARWLCGPREAQGLLADSRRRLGAVWHWPVIIYVLAIWLAWAGGVPNALGVMLRGLLVLVAGLALGRLVWAGTLLALERLLPHQHHLPEAPQPRHPLLNARARAYLPLVRTVLGGLVSVLTVLGILQGWGLGMFAWLITDPLSRALLSALVSISLTVGVALTLWEAFNILLQARVEGLTEAGRTRQSARLRTLRPMLRTLVGIVVGTVSGLTVLAEIGVNATGLVAGASVIGIAVGFGSQKLVQDVITGLFLLLEDALQVGDYVSVAGLSGVVEHLSIRTIRLRANDGSLNIIPFSSVGTVTNMTRDFSYAVFSVHVDYSADPRAVFALIRDVAADMRADESFGPMIRDDVQIFGVDEFSVNGMVITGRIRTGPGQHWAVRREFYARIKAKLEAAGIAIPYVYNSPPARLPPPPGSAAEIDKHPPPGT
jgi:small conductance mechanosensitive channel